MSNKLVQDLIFDVGYNAGMTDAIRKIREADENDDIPLDSSACASHFIRILEKYLSDVYGWKRVK